MRVYVVLRDAPANGREVVGPYTRDEALQRGEGVPYAARRFFHIPAVREAYQTYRETTDPNYPLDEDSRRLAPVPRDTLRRPPGSR